MKLPAFISRIFNPVVRMDASQPGFSNSGGSFYDAAFDSASRSSFVAFPVVARREFTRTNRVNILKKVRALEANLGLISRMKSQVGKYAVGFGVFPFPQTKDAPWNEESRTKFMDWGNNPNVSDVAGAMTFWERQRFHAETIFAEAESFDALVSSSISGFPQLQLFDSSEIGMPFYTPPDGQFVVDGVRVNDNNKAVSYIVATQPPSAGIFSSTYEVREIDAADMIHVIRRKRANQLRGVSPFAPGVNSAIDQLDLRSVITASAKLHEALGLVVKKKSGDAGKKGITGQVKKLVDGDGKVTQVDEKFIRGAIIQYLGIDEELDIVSSDRPTQNILDFLVFLIRDICLGTGLSFEIVWNLADLGGATARIALADAQWFFDSIQDTLNDRFNQRVWVWWAASMMKNGQLSRCSDPRWWNCHWQGPAKLTADEGYTAQAQIDRLYSGQDNWQDQYGRRGRAWKPALTQRIDEMAWLNEQCAKAGVDPNLIFAPKPGTVVQVHGAQQEGQ